MSTAQPTVKTVQFTDPRIEPQPDPVYDYVIAPTQNQYYKINASSKGIASIAFNNLTTLGVDRAYLDTFEIELTATFDFTIADQIDRADAATAIVCPAPDEWTFDSFPFNKCCEQIHANINGGAFFSQPLSYLRAKERYMDQKALSTCYENTCPIHKPICQYETGEDYNRQMPPEERRTQYNQTCFTRWSGTTAGHALYPITGSAVGGGGAITDTTMSTTAALIGTWGSAAAIPTRYGIGMFDYMQSSEGMQGGFNNAIVRLGPPINDGNGQPIGYQNYHFKMDAQGNPDFDHMIVTVTWREPVLCSPFSSRYDSTYGRPLYNITSMDLTFTLQSLQNMIRVANIHNKRVPLPNGGAGNTHVASYTVSIDSAQLCYQVMTIPPIMKKPLTTLVPYRRFVPYITDFPTSAMNRGNPQADGSRTNVNIDSGVYTFNEIPTAIWLFVAPSKLFYQQSYDDIATGGTLDTNSALLGNWDSNKLFGYINHVSLTMANTTQILNTAEPVDLYRIAKANGCQDSYLSWSGSDVARPRGTYSSIALGGDNPTLGTILKANYQGAGSVLRLIPGVDLIVPDQALIPGANANNMVFKAEVTCTIPPRGQHTNPAGAGAAPIDTTYSLWLLFEYVGVAAISPGQCEITMNPLGSGEIMAASPIVSGTNDNTDGTIEGSGWLDKLVHGFRKAQHTAKDTGVVSKILKLLPNETSRKAGEWAEQMGYGERGCKRARGGAVMGKGLADWSV